nr:reverse transcriptase domain-containing protein [Tanacetum cinerariifolium]
MSNSSAIHVADAPNQCQQQSTTPSTSTTIAVDTPSLNIQTTPETTSQAPTQAPTVTATENINQAETNKNPQVNKDEFINIFSTPGMTLCDSIGIPMATKRLDANLSGTLIDQTKYRSMVGALMYLTASRPDIFFRKTSRPDIVHATCYCARYQARPTKNHLKEVKRIFWLAPYSIELAAYNITYEPRSAIKEQILADFINEVPVGSKAMVPRQTPCTIDHDRERKEEWILYTDGAASAKGSGAGLVLIIPTKTEYIYEACKENMIRYLNKAKEYIGCFKKFKIQNKPRNKNQKADVLSKLASVAFNHLTKEILVETLDVPSMDVEEINVVVEEEGETWMTPIINCLESGIWPED